MQAGDSKRSRIPLAAALTATGAGAVLFLVVLGYASAGSANPTPAQYQYGPTQDSVVGSGSATFQGITEQYSVSAFSGPSGAKPQGQLTLRSPLLDSSKSTAAANVTCVKVTGNHAQVGGTLTQPVFYNGDGPFRWLELIVDDHGRSGDTLNAFIFLVRTHPPDFDPCTVDGVANLPVHGNFTVTDAAPSH